MILPKFILGDNTNFPEAIFVIHTEFPRFMINLKDDEIEEPTNYVGADLSKMVNEKVRDKSWTPEPRLSRKMSSKLKIYKTHCVGEDGGCRLKE